MPNVNRRFTSPLSMRTLAILSLLIVAFVAAACGAASGPGAPQNGGDDLAGGPAPGAGSGTDGVGPGEQLASLADQRIIKNGEIGIEVPDVTLALARVRAMAQDLGGYVGGSQAGTRDEAATLTLRIPADRFEDALAALHELDGDVVIEATNEQDVTSTVVDLEARDREPAGLRDPVPHAAQQSGQDRGHPGGPDAS